jgi:hypothetical protein
MAMTPGAPRNIWEIHTDGTGLRKVLHPFDQLSPD